MTNSSDQLCINTLRFLSVDAVEKANSGHPGLPLGAAPMAYAIWDRCLRHNPKNPQWFNRDRFILSAGHGSALIYALLHLYGYDLSLDEVRNFRQWGSLTPGHPEYGLTPGVEVTTGPLGQGFAMGVGMAMAEYYLSGLFNTNNEKIIDHHTYAIVSDGDLMEGISSEAASLAGHLGLGKLIYLYDDNRITIDGSTDLAFSEDVDKRFESYGWHVQFVEDGNDVDAIETAVRNAQKEHDKPSIIRVRTHIGYGSPKQDTASVHGEALGADAMRATKENLGWPTDKDFFIPEESLTHFRRVIDSGKQVEASWHDDVAQYAQANPEKAALLETIIRGDLPEGWEKDIPVFEPGDGMATRQASGVILNAIAERLPHLIGGSADLAPSNKTYLKDKKVIGLDGPTGRNIHFGVREHAMGGIVNGMAIHGGVVPYSGTFLIFSDYMRPSIRLAALMGAPSTFVFTHDSVALGEDGPTHQPIEHLMSLRAMPELVLIRPADANETAAAWRIAIESDGPVAIALTRQKLPTLAGVGAAAVDNVRKGAYVLDDSQGMEIVLVATGSEVPLVLEARKELEKSNISARVVSMPSWELFENQDDNYKKSVLPPDVPKLAVEAGSPKGWREYVGDSGDVIGIDRFGASAPGGVALDKLGINVGHVVARAMKLLGRA